jgi:hypothetical protein
LDKLSSWYNCGWNSPNFTAKATLLVWVNPHSCAANMASSKLMLLWLHPGDIQRINACDLGTG